MLVREVEVRRRREGGDCLRVVLGDRSGSVSATIWDELAAAREIYRPGAIVHVTGTYSVNDRFGPQLAVQSARAADEAEYDRAELVDGPHRAPEQMEADLRELLATIQNPHLRQLLALVFGEDSAIWAGYRDAPAAKRYHQAYRHGLLEHSLTVAQAVERDLRHLPRHRPRRGRHRRAAARHRQARRLRDGRRRDLDVRPRPSVR